MNLTCQAGLRSGLESSAQGLVAIPVPRHFLAKYKRGGNRWVEQVGVQEENGAVLVNMTEISSRQ